MILRMLLAFLPASLAFLSGCAPTGRTITASKSPTSLDHSPVQSTADTSETYTDEDLDHLSIFLDATEAEAYPAMSVEQRRELMRKAWASLDPTPTTDRNEREEEHYRRLAEARENFSRDGSPPWDMRGELLIRYGSPQVRDVIPATIEYGTVIPPQEIWMYTQPNMTFEMTDLLLKDDFQDSYLWQESGRADIAAQGKQTVDQESAISREVRGPSVTEEDFRGRRLIGKGFHALHENTQSYVHNFGGRKLDYIFDVMNFATTTRSMTEVEIGFLFRAADLQYMGGAATLDVDVVAKTMDYREVARASHTMRQNGPLASNQLVADQVALELAPGDYRLALQVRDPQSRSVGVFTTTSTVREFTRDHLEISDLQLASSVQPGQAGKAGDAGSRFSKGDVLVVPHPGGFYPQGGSVSFYFEVYGLTIPSSGSAEFTFTYTVTPRTADRAHVRPTISISNDETPTTPEVQRYFSFNTTSMEPGLYDVEVRVTDRLTNASASQSAQLRIDKSTSATARLVPAQQDEGL